MLASHEYKVFNNLFYFRNYGVSPKVDEVRCHWYCLVCCNFGQCYFIIIFFLLFLNGVMVSEASLINHFHLAVSHTQFDIKKTQQGLSCYKTKLPKLFLNFTQDDLQRQWFFLVPILQICCFLPFYMQKKWFKKNVKKMGYAKISA